jgi:hypothetical protein
MKVSLASHGGLAAGLLLGRRPAVVDGADLPAADSHTLDELVHAARAEPAPEKADGSARDAMSYTVTVEDASGTWVLRRPDDSMTPAFAALVDWLGSHAPGGN